MKTARIITLMLLLLCGKLNAQSSKFDKWQTPGFFHGYNMTDWDNQDERDVYPSDFVKLKSIGANLVDIQIEGLWEVDPPYRKHIWWAEDGDTTFYIEILDNMVRYARSAGLMYVITIRTGPGRIDVSDEENESSIWTNREEQLLYASMVKRMITPFVEDSLFVGVDPLIEPNPLFLLDDGEPTIPAAKQAFEDAGIDVNALYTLLIDSIRTVSEDLPIMVEGPYFSDPEYFGFVDKQEDPYIVYKVHLYNPAEFTHAEENWSVTYPGTYFSIRLQEERRFDRSFLEQEVYRPVLEFQNRYQVPVFVGEMGVSRPQHGAMKFLRDISSIACIHGWHYAFWGFNDGPEFNYWDMDSLYGTRYVPVIERLMSCEPVTSNIDRKEDSDIVIYPNPSGDILHIRLGSKATADSALRFYNALGAEVTSNISCLRVGGDVRADVSVLPPGVYFIFIREAPNQRAKIVKWVAGSPR